MDLTRILALEPKFFFIIELENCLLQSFYHKFYKSENIIQFLAHGPKFELVFNKFYSFKFNITFELIFSYKMF